MQLFQYFLHLYRDWQSEMSGIFQKGDALVGNVEKYHRCSKYRACSDHLHIKDICNPHQQKNQYLSADALKPDFTGQFFLPNGTHHSRDIIHRHKGKQGIEQPVKAAQKPSEPSSGSRKNKLNRVPKFFHVKFLSFFDFVYEKSDCPKLDSLLLPKCSTHNVLCAYLSYLYLKSPCYFPALE